MQTVPVGKSQYSFEIESDELATSPILHNQKTRRYELVQQNELVDPNQALAQTRIHQDSLDFTLTSSSRRVIYI
jgi:hypothetical protein